MVFEVIVFPVTLLIAFLILFCSFNILCSILDQSLNSESTCLKSGLRSSGTNYPKSNGNENTLGTTNREKAIESEVYGEAVVLLSPFYNLIYAGYAINRRM